MTPDQAVAAQAIAHTQSVYATEGDRGRLDGLVTAFTEDGVLEFHGGRHEGHAAIKASLEGGLAVPRERFADTRGFVRHNLTTRRIEFDGPDAADVFTYFMVMTPLGLDHTGRYVDRFVRSGERWLIAHRRVTLDWAAAGSRQEDNVRR
jgi:hypothetical protein